MAFSLGFPSAVTSDTNNQSLSPSKILSSILESSLSIGENPRRLSTGEVLHLPFAEEEYKKAISSAKKLFPDIDLIGSIYQAENTISYRFLTKKEAEALKASGKVLNEIATVNKEEGHKDLIVEYKTTEYMDSPISLAVNKILLTSNAIKTIQPSSVTSEDKELSDITILKICTKAQKTLATKKYSKQSPLLIDLEKKEFLIILGDAAKIQAGGKFGKVESVIRVINIALEDQLPIASHFVLKTPKDNTTIEQEEIRLTKLYQKGHEWKYQDKSALAVEAFDGTLSLKIDDTELLGDDDETGSINDYKKNLHILKQLIQQLEEMHSNNDVHLDLKQPNILARRTSDGHYSVQIADFGSANKDLTIYGTFACSSPETIIRFKNGCTPFASDTGEKRLRYTGENQTPFTVQEKKAQDVYALGLIGFAIACGGQPEWVNDIGNSMIERGIFGLETLENALEAQKQVSPLIKKLKDYQVVEGQKLLDFIAELLEPDPARRPTIEQCREKIAQFS